MIRSIHPEDCGCTDCVMGVTKPINECSESELHKAFNGEIRNCSACVIVKESKKAKCNKGHLRIYDVKLSYESN